MSTISGSTDVFQAFDRLVMEGRALPIEITLATGALAAAFEGRQASSIQMSISPKQLSPASMVSSTGFKQVAEGMLGSFAVQAFEACRPSIAANWGEHASGWPSEQRWFWALRNSVSHKGRPFNAASKVSQVELAGVAFTQSDQEKGALFSDVFYGADILFGVLDAVAKISGKVST